jgi:hypothetical protein
MVKTKLTNLLKMRWEPRQKPLREPFWRLTVHEGGPRRRRSVAAGD